MGIKRNLHTIDIITRALVGTVLVYISFVDTSYISNDFARWLVGSFGAINMIAAAFRSCPIYALAGISTYRSA